MHNISDLGRYFWSFGLPFALLTAGAHGVSAFPMTVFDNELEAVMLGQEADTEMLPRIRQAFELLPFTSKMNPAGGTFSYATDEGTKYSGLPLSLAASGTYDPTAHTGEWTSTATLGAGEGALTWIGTGSLAPDISDPTAQDVSFRMDIISGSDFLDYRKIMSFRPSGTGLGSCQYTMNGVPIGVCSDRHSIESPEPVEHWNTEEISETSPTFAGFDLVADGSVDQSSGNGTFVVHLVPPVPEPTSVAMVATGIAGMLGAAWARRRHVKSVSIAPAPRG